MISFCLSLEKKVIFKLRQNKTKTTKKKPEKPQRMRLYKLCNYPPHFFLPFFLLFISPMRSYKVK